MQVPKVVAIEKMPKIKKATKGVAQIEVVPYDDVGNEEGPRIKLSTRQTVMPLMHLVQQLAYQADKLQAIKDMGFGGFLHLAFPHNFPEFSAQLVLNFDAVGMKFNLDRNRSFDVKSADVHMVYGIPRGGKEIMDAKDDNEDYKKVLDSYKRYHGGVLPNNVNKLIVEIPLDDDWKRSFLVLVVNCCIKSIQNQQPYLRVQPSIDVDIPIPQHLEGVLFEEKYHDYPEKIRDAFAMYLNEYEIKLGEKMSRYTVKLVEMPWRTLNNNVD
uniref:Uncharacterized protein n=1 Tax=Chenopodium quinoa TaxID=63459 RepID=A0A803KSM5_CHEQI